MFRETRKLVTSAMKNATHVDASGDIAGPTIANWKLWKDKLNIPHPFCGAVFSNGLEGTGTRSWKLGDTASRTHIVWFVALRKRMVNRVSGVDNVLASDLSGSQHLHMFFQILVDGRSTASNMSCVRLQNEDLF